MTRISRRTFLGMTLARAAAGAPAAAWLYMVGKAHAQPQVPQVVRIAHLSNRHGHDSEMASQAIMGAQLGAEEANVTAGMFGTTVELIVEDAATPDNVLLLARQLSAQEHLAAIVA